MPRRPQKPPRSRKSQPRRPLPAPRIRPATVADAAVVRDLLHELGYRATVRDVTRRLRALLATGSDPIFLAIADGGAVGLMALHSGSMLQYREPVTRITTLVVAASARGTGIGRLLVAHAAKLAKARGCGALELTTGLARHDAQAFYRAIGFNATALRFVMPLSSRMKRRLDYRA